MLSHQNHLERVRATMRGAGIDLMFLTYGPDMTYVTGVQVPQTSYNSRFNGGEGEWITGVLFGIEKDPVIILQKSYHRITVEPETWVRDIRVVPWRDRAAVWGPLTDGDSTTETREEAVSGDPDAFLGQVLAEFDPNGKTIAVDRWCPWRTVQALQAAAPGARLVLAAREMMDDVRSIKDDDELEIMQRAAQITDRALAQTLKQIKPGITERDVSNELMFQLLDAGAQNYSFYPGIICVGNGSDPKRHIMVRNTDMVLAPGTTVAFDFGVVYQGYCTDFGRTAFVGEPLPEALAAYRSLTATQKATLEIMADGQVSPAGIVKFVEDRMREDGYLQWHAGLGLGHTIDLEAHELPAMYPQLHNWKFHEPIRAGMCFALEPKIWNPGIFYVRCEDVIVVEKERSRSLTKFHYEPNVIV